MPFQNCRKAGKPGIRWGSKGRCYTYTAGDKESIARAKKKAEAQMIAIQATGFKE